MRDTYRDLHAGSEVSRQGKVRDALANACRQTDTWTKIYISARKGQAGMPILRFGRLPFGAATSGFAPSHASGASRPFRLPSLTQAAGAGMLAAGKGWVLAILAMLAQAGCAWLRVAPVPASPPWPFAVLPAALEASGRGASRQQSTPKMACRPGVEQGAMASKKRAIAK